MVQNELYHHGVKGMKWGVRKAPVRSGRTTSKNKRPERNIFGFRKKEQEKTSKTAVKKEPTPESKPKSIKDMSDAELRDRINRLRLEEDYRKLNPQHISNGKKIVDRVANNILLPAAEDVAKQLVKSGMTKAVNDIFKLDDDLKIYTNNKKK